MSEMEQFLSEEYAWTEAIVKKGKRQTTVIGLPLTFLGLEAGILAIALANKATQAEIIRNLLIGLGIFAFIAILIALMVLLPNGAKGHMKFLNKKMNKVLPDEAARNDFARQMLQQNNGNTCRLSFKMDSMNWLVDISRDYVFARSQVGLIDIVRLNDVEGIQMEKDSGKCFPLHFFYHGNRTRGTRNEVPDVRIPLKTQEMQRKAAEFISNRGGR